MVLSLSLIRRNDALVMNLLQSSPRIVSLYSHCAGTVVTEAAVQDLSDVVVPFGGYKPEEEEFDNDDVDPLNNLTVSEKLNIALEMAEAIADMHGKFYSFSSWILVMLSS